MKHLNDFTFGVERKSKYDWKTIFDGNTYELIHKEDFNCSVRSFRVYVIKQSKKMSIPIQTQINGENLIVKANISGDKTKNST